MSFETLYEKYMNGTATDEEIAYVEEEIEKARKLGEIIEASKAKPIEFEEADDESIKKAKKQHNVKSVLRAVVVSVAVLIVVAGAVLGGVFGTAISSAKKQVTIGADYAKEIAIDYYRNNYYSSGGLDKILVTNFEKDVVYGSNLAHSYYKYEIEVKQPGGYELDVEIDSRTGEVRVIDVEPA